MLGLLRPRQLRRSDPWLVAAVIFVGGGIALLVSSGAIAAPLVALALVLFGAVALHIRSRLWELSPIVALVSSYVAVALLGPLLSGAASQALGASARIVLSDQESLATYFVFMVAAGGAVVGALMTSFVIRTAPLPVRRVQDYPTKRRAALILLALAPATLTILMYREELLYRPTYLIGAAGSPLVIAAQVLNIPALAILGWLTRSSKTARGKALSWIAIGLYVLLLFSLATRALSLIPLLVAIGILAADPSSRKAHALLLSAAVVSVFLLQMPLMLRGSTEHGLLPYFALLFSERGPSPGVIVALSNFLFSYALTGAVAFQIHPIGWASALVSLDPRPGALTDWYTMQAQLNLNPSTPDNALGELANLGLWPLFTFFALVGAFFGYLDRRIRRLLSDGSTLSALLLFALTTLFVLESLQYNLRSATRVIYYLILVDLAIRLGMKVWKRDGKSSAGSSRLKSGQFGFSNDGTRPLQPELINHHLGSNSG